jgi:hypothetical protein
LPEESWLSLQSGGQSAHELPQCEEWCLSLSQEDETSMSIIETVQQRVGAPEIQQISQQLGIDNATAQRAVQSALPALVAGMAGHAQQPAGEQRIQSLLGSHADILGNLGGLLGGGAPADSGILGSVLGQHQATVNNEVQQTSGLDSTKSRQLLMILAPIVLGALAHKRAENQQRGNVGDVLKQEAQQSPRAGGLLGKILAHVEMPRH